MKAEETETFTMDDLANFVRICSNLSDEGMMRGLEYARSLRREQEAEKASAAEIQEGRQ